MKFRRKFTLAMLAAIIGLAGAEENSILDLATQSTNGVWSAITWNTKAGIDGGFRGLMGSGGALVNSGGNEF